MTEPGAEVMDALMDLDMGEDVRVTVERDGEELEIDAYVVETYYEPPEKDAWGWIDGDLHVHMEASDETVADTWLPTHSLSVMASESHPGEWKRVGFTVWDPEVEDGTVVRDDYADVGDITGVEVENDG